MPSERGKKSTRRLILAFVKVFMIQSFPGRCLHYFSTAVIKCHDQSNLKTGGLSYGSRDTRVHRYQVREEHQQAGEVRGRAERSHLHPQAAGRKRTSRGWLRPLKTQSPPSVSHRYGLTRLHLLNLPREPRQLGVRHSNAPLWGKYSNHRSMWLTL